MKSEFALRMVSQPSWYLQRIAKAIVVPFDLVERITEKVLATLLYGQTCAFLITDITGGAPINQQPCTSSIYSDMSIRMRFDSSSKV